MIGLILLIHLNLSQIGCLEASDPPADPKTPEKVFEPREEAVGQPYGGVVTGIAHDSITIHWAHNGIVANQVRPKQFAASGVLAAGGVPVDPRIQAKARGKYVVLPSFMYRLEDVRVGDWVDIEYARINGADICDHICIKKRPSGRVPRLPEQAEAIRLDQRVRDCTFPGGPTRKEIEARYIRWDEFINAYWDLEDKGIPYPEKFGPMRRWPIAPMPRKLTLDGPAISK